ncbi:phosphopantetheine-binding protein [Nonomuraea sp. NPDC051941]|uniref:phosphopantetheine-binding protein n=1 Tax=Nonomuraea sp. NPDC051941 TaxID=3364373 RepID=UPI0037CA1814
MVNHTDPQVDTVETLAALRRVPDVRGAVVTGYVGVDGRTMLLGYVTGPDPAVGTIRIRQHLSSRLPGYLIPDHLFVLDALPLTPEGDYDLSALPTPEADLGPADAHVAPRTPVERRLAEIFQELLGVSDVGVHDDFFALGGSSIVATRLAARVREVFAVEVSLVDVLAASTVDELARLVDEA